MALYWRDRGQLSLIDKEPGAAVADLRVASSINPSDDQAWRSLAIAFAAVGNDAEARTALDLALKTQRSDPSNLLLSAVWDGKSGSTTAATETLAEAVQAWPALVGAPGWSGILPPSVTTGQIIAKAAIRWGQGLSMPELATDQGLWLAILADRPDLEPAAIRNYGISPTLAKAELMLLTCSPAESVLDRASNDDRRNPFYWELRFWSASLRGEIDSRARTAVRIASGNASFPAFPADMLNPLNDNGPFSSDFWGYRRLPIEWPDVGLDLPSPNVGQLRWLSNPRAAASAADLNGLLSAC